MCQSTVSLGEKQAQYFLWQQVDLINQQQAVKSENFARSCLPVECFKSLGGGNFQQFHYETIFILQPFCCLPRAPSVPKVVSLVILWISYFGIQKTEHNGSERKGARRHSFQWLRLNTFSIFWYCTIAVHGTRLTSRCLFIWTEMFWTSVQINGNKFCLVVLNVAAQGKVSITVNLMWIQVSNGQTLSFEKNEVMVNMSSIQKWLESTSSRNLIEFKLDLWWAFTWLPASFRLTYESFMIYLNFTSLNLRFFWLDSKFTWLNLSFTWLSLFQPFLNLNLTRKNLKFTRKTMLLTWLGKH